MKLLTKIALFWAFTLCNLLGADQKIEVQIEELLSQMTLEEKVRMCHAQSKFSAAGVSRIGVPELWLSDGPHGVRPEIAWDSWSHAGWTNDFCTAFPALTCLAATFNPELSYAYGVALGEESLYREKDIILGPGVNIYRTPLNGRNFEYMGEDPYLASQLVVPYVQGVQSNGVAACVKHLVLNNQEYWRHEVNVEISERALREIYLPAFKAAIVEGGAWSVMGAYNLFRGQHCCHNELLLNHILKDEWGFDGIVVSDWGGTYDTTEAALYGLDLEMGTGTNGLTFSEDNAYDNYYLALPFLDKIKKGEISESVLDDKVRRLLRLRLRTNMDRSRGFGRMMCEDHSRVARSVATEGMVLLKNENDFFPLDAGASITIAVIGENATRMMTIGGGSSELKAKYEISPLEGIQKRFKNAKIVHSMGYGSGESDYDVVLPSPYDAEALKKDALEVAANADFVLFFGGLNKSHNQDCEGADRLQLGLLFGQDELIADLLKVNPNMAVLLISGNAVEMPWIDEVAAIFQVWYLGSETGHAIADVLSGDVTPSGKLPFTFPKKLEDNPAHRFGEKSYPGIDLEQEYMEDIFVGYRGHDEFGIEPLFPFGFGLSYTDFEISDVTVDDSEIAIDGNIRLRCKLTNTGPVKGAETVQVYIGKSNSKVKREKKALKGFKKVSVDAGESELVTITIPVKDLAYYETASKSWVVETGDYRLWVGNSSASGMSKSFRVK